MTTGSDPDLHHEAVADQYRAAVRELARLIREHHKKCNIPYVCIGSTVRYGLQSIDQKRRDALLLTALNMLAENPWPTSDPEEPT